MSLKRKSRSLGQLAGLGTANFSASKMATNQKSGAMRPSRHPGEHDENHMHKKISRTTPKRLKGLVRPRPSSTTPLGKSVFGRSKQNNMDNLSRENLHDLMTLNQTQIIPNRNRTFLMDTQVMFTVGLQCQERSLFLFSDMLLIAKERSSSNFKLKDQVPLSDLWLSNCISDVSEVTLDPSRSFVIGWPITNAVVTLSSSSQKEIWWDKLTSLIKQERRHNPSSTNIQIGYFEQSSNFEHVKNLCVRRDDTAVDCISAALKVLDLTGVRPNDLQLWVRTKTNESPYPLIGHEIPLVIKMHWMKKNFDGQNQKSYEDYKQGTRCSFILRKTGPATTGPILPSPSSQKYTLKKVTSSIRLQNVFRRVSHGSSSSNKQDSDQKSPKKDSNSPTGKLFGHALDKVQAGNNGIPKSIEMVLAQLLDDGPTTVGIFRRSPNARAMRELRNKLDDGEIVDFKECSVFVTAALLKDFLRSLPDSLLPSDTFSTWTEMTKDTNNEEKIAAAKRLLSKLSECSYSMLKHVIFILKEIANRAQDNMMTSSNLAICVGPCILWSSDPQVLTGAAYASDVSRVTKLLIDEFDAIFGTDVPPVFASVTTLPAKPVKVQSTLSSFDPKSVTRTPPLSKHMDSLKPFPMQRSYTTLDKSTLDSVLFPVDEPKKVSLPSLLDDDDDDLADIYDVERISSSHDNDDTEENDESDILARRAMHLFPIKNNVDLFWGESAMRHHRDVVVGRRHVDDDDEDHYLVVGRSEHNGYYNKSPYKRRTVNQKKRQAPLPPDGRSPKAHSKVVRSNSVNQVRGGGGGGGGSAGSGLDEFVFKPMLQWNRSKSTTRLNIATNSGSSGSGGGSNSTDDEIQMTILPSDEFGQILVDNYYADPAGLALQGSPNPPDYDETISRQRILRYYRRPEGASPRLYQEATSPLNAHQMASLSINDNNNGYRMKSGHSNDHLSQAPPPPLPPKERPPLPPKQRYSQRSSINSLGENTYANMTAFYPRYGDTSSGDLDDDDDIYTAYSAVGIDEAPPPPPPHLPPKESKSLSSTSSSLSTTATQTLSMCDAETQTNEDDFYAFYADEDEIVVDDEILSYPGDLSFDQQSGSVDVVLASDDRASASHLFTVPSPRESPRSSALSAASMMQPAWGLPTRQYHQQPKHQSPMQQGLPQQQMRQFQTTPQHPLLQQRQRSQLSKDNLHGEKISWSVSQLRSLFNQDRNESAESYSGAGEISDPLHQHESSPHRETDSYQRENLPTSRHRYQQQPVGSTKGRPSANYNSPYPDEHSDEESYV